MALSEPTIIPFLMLLHVKVMIHYATVYDSLQNVVVQRLNIVQSSYSSRRYNETVRNEA